MSVYIKKTSVKKLFLFSIFVFSLLSCGNREKEDVIVMGMSPIYLDANDFSQIKSEPPREFGELGTIVNVGNYIFINELRKGIHVLDNSKPKNPNKVKFWNIPGNTLFSIDGNLLYADNSINLLIIDISNINDIKVVSYISDVYLGNQPLSPRPPNSYKGYFECIDKHKGIHIDWETKELINPRCEAY